MVKKLHIKGEQTDYVVNYLVDLFILGVKNFIIIKTYRDHYLIKR